MVAKFWIPIIVGLSITGCGHFTKVENVYIDNSASNNLIGNPCKFYIGLRGEQYCMTEIPRAQARNPDSPYKKEQNVK
jgi:hypothetical protein